MESLCIICKDNTATIGDPKKWCSRECQRKDPSKQAETKQEPQSQPTQQIKQEIKSEPIIQPKTSQVVQEVIKKPKICIQCQKQEAKNHLPQGSYCDKCFSDQKKICVKCGKETEGFFMKEDGLYCEKCGISSRGKSTKTKQWEGNLNDPEKIVFVHLYPNKKPLNAEDNEKNINTDSDEVDYTEYIDYYESFLFSKAGTKKENLSKVQQWRITHHSTIPRGDLPDIYSSIAKLPEGDIFLVTGGFHVGPNGNYASDICYAVIFDRRIEKKDIDESKVKNEKTSLNVKSFRYTIFKDEHMTNRRAAHCSIIVDDNLYVFGGRADTYDTEDNFTGFNYVKSCERMPVSKVRKNMIKAIINPTVTVFINEKWTSIGDLSEPRSNAMCFAYSKRIYIFGGYVGPKKLASKVEVYDTVENKWSQLSIKHQFLAGSVVLLDGDDAYIVGGSDENGPTDGVYRWDLKKNEIIHVKDMSMPRSEAKGTIAETNGEKFLYIMGGRVSEMDYEFISLSDLNDKKKKFEHVEIKEVDLEVKYDAIPELKGDKLIFPPRKFNPLEPCLFNEGYIGENVLILPD